MTVDDLETTPAPHAAPPANQAFLLTPPGSAAIAVLRIIGPAVSEFLLRHFSRPARVGRCVHGNLADESRIIDDPVVVVVADGKVADINLHGGPWVVRSAMDLLQRKGFVLTEGGHPLGNRTWSFASSPGTPREDRGEGLPRFHRENPPHPDPLPDHRAREEYPTRSPRGNLPLADEWIDGQTEIEREVMTHLPLARTELGVRVLLGQVQAWKDLVEKLSRNPAGSRKVVQAVLQDKTLHHLLHPARVAIVGTANVGKSTLANQLFAQERSITADVPGTTRDWVGEIANIDGFPVMLIDTPGQRSTSDSIERLAIERSLQQVAVAQVVLLVLDRSQPVEPEQAPLLRKYPQAIRIANKCDRAAAWDEAEAWAIRCSATSGAGIADVRAAIVEAICGNPKASTTDILPMCWTDRQRRLLEDSDINPDAPSG